MISKGTTFGRLTVLRNATRQGYVVCQCECGNIKEIRSSSLTKAYQPTRSCGCIQRETASRIGNETISSNSKSQIATNVRHNTNFQVIENPYPPKNNRSGHKGVWWNEKRGMWESYITIHRKRIHLGRFFDYDEAVKARLRAEEEYFLPLIDKKRGCDNG